MLKSLSGYQGTPVTAQGADAGAITRFAIDLDQWIVRHIAVSTETADGQAELLISPAAIAGGTDRDGLALATAPSVHASSATALEQPDHGRLVDSSDLIGAHIDAVDGSLGHVDDLIVEDDNWHVRYVVVDTRNWWLGKHVLLAPEWIDRFDAATRTVHVNVNRDAIKDAPEYDAGYLLTRDDEAAVFRHYQRRPYWSE